MSLEFVSQIDAAHCIGCELCVNVCLPSARFDDASQYAIVTRSQPCEYTGACQQTCPTEAISLFFEIVVSAK